MADWRARIQAERKRLGWTQTDLAKRIRSSQPSRLKEQQGEDKTEHVSQSTVSDWERGIGSPTVDQLRELSTVLGVPLAELVGEPTSSTGEAA